MNRFRKNKRAFDPARPVYAKRELTINGVRYPYGIEIDWRALNISQRTVEQLFRVRHVDHGATTVLIAGNRVMTDKKSRRSRAALV